MGNKIDYFLDGTKIEMIEIPETDHSKYCVRCTKEMWVDFSTQTVKPCSFSSGVHIDDYNGFFQYINDINNNVKRIECNYCHQINPNFRLEGNSLWTTPHHGNSHVEFILGDTFDNDTLIKYVNLIAEDCNKFACICVSGDEPGKTMLEQNHIELIANPFFLVNRLKYRKLRYDFKTNLDFSLKRTKRIVKYMKAMRKRYPNLNINIQPSELSLTKDFDEKIDLFVNAKFEIVARSLATKDRLETRYSNHKNIKLTIQI
jgi:hypothetical protein